jgi:DNA-binding transcriptional LysR family regulator
LRINLPIELLRSLVAIVDTGSMSRASHEIFLTQSALSLQMKRLSELIQLPIFDRHSRGLTLTPDGKTFLAYARAILELNDQAIASLSGGPLAAPARIGMIQDFADGLLTGVLARFSRLHQGPQLHIRIGNSSELLSLLSGGVLDVVICLASSDDPAAVVVPQMVWLGHAHLSEGKLPLALMERPCVFRDAALAALDEAGIEYNIVLETPSTSVLRAAVEAGLAVTCRTAAFLPDKFPRLDCPTTNLPRVAISLHTAPALPAPICRLAGFIREAILAEGKKDFVN